jgi:hypothetical protein
MTKLLACLITLSSVGVARGNKETTSRTYVQFTMGFLAGGRSYRDATFENQNGVAPTLSAPLLVAPYDGSTAVGLRYELRIAIAYLRGTIGVDLPFPDFRARDTTASYLIDGKAVTVSVQSLRPYELRFGIGGEYPIWVFAPFVDLIGYTHWTDTTLSVDGARAGFQAQGFGFALRAGVRVHVKEWFFVQVSSEAGLYGPVRWNADLSIGFAVPANRRAEPR